MKKRKLFLWLSILMIISVACSADDEVFGVEEIIISATRVESSLDRVSISSAVISEDQIKASNANDLSDLLSATNVVQTVDYGTGSLSTISLRGGTSAQVLVLVDGKRINDSRGGGANLDMIPISNVERVEIIRGGQSAMYGADAVGGIINVITKKPRNSSIKASANTGSYGLQSYNVEASKRISSLAGIISLSRTSAKSDFPYEDRFGQELIRKNADYAKRNAYVRLNWDILNSMSVDLSANHFYSDANTPGMVGFYTPNAEERDKANDFSLNFNHQITPIASYKLIAYDRYALMRYINPTYPYASDDTHKTNSRGAELQLNFFGNTNYPIVGGVLSLNEAVDSTAVGDRDRRTYSGYLQQEISKEFNAKALKRISIFPAIRWDHYSDFEAGTSPKLGFLVSLFDVMFLKANIGKSYRAPTMNDLYWPSSAMTSGNPNLKPERSNDADIGIQVNLLNQLNKMAIKLGTSYFQNSISDGIQWSPTQNDRWVPLNLAEINTKGTESDLRLIISMLDIPNFVTINGSYNFISAKDSLGNQLIYRPKHSAGYAVRIGTDELWFQVQGLHQGRRYYTTANTKWLDPFMKHDFQIGVERGTWNKAKIGLNMELKNAFNTKYQLSADYPMPGREWGFKVYFGMEGE